MKLKLKGRTLSLGEKDKQVSWATWHEDEDINKGQASKLVRNMTEKKGELLKQAIFNLLGHFPTSKKASKHLSMIEDLKDSNVVWVFWRKRPVAVYTKPQSHIKDCRYYLTWYWRTLTPFKHGKN